MKFKLLALSSVALLSSCEWTGNQLDGMSNWANKNMPTFDGSRPGLTKTTSQGGMIPDQYNGYPYTNPNNAAAPALPGQGIVSTPGMTAKQAASAYEGGNSRPPMPMMPPPTPYKPTPNAPRGMMPPPPPAYTPPPPSAYDTGRRAPSNQLPPSAIQPAPYGMHQPLSNKPQDDFPSEYNNTKSPNADDMNPMVPPPPPPGF